MSTLQVINGINYFKAEAVRTVCPHFFVGCMRSVRNILERKKIPEHEYTFATYVKSRDEWKPSNIDVNKAALLLTEEWVLKNVPGFAKKKDITSSSTDEDIKQVPLAPPILLLNDNEKFKDVDGNNIEVDVRGERHPDKIFFYGKDIERMLQMENLRVVLTQDLSGYEDGEHYKKFVHLKYVTNTSGGQKRSCYYLTYMGLIKLLLSRKHPIAKTFQKWVTNILFTHHLGTTEQKQELACTLIGASVESVRDFLSSSPSKYSELYLICIGKSSDLKDSLQLHLTNTYTDNDLVFKYGYSDDLSRRLKEHKNKFSKLVGTNISVVLHSPIDPKYLSKAEMELKQYFQEEEACLDHPVYKELVVMSERKIKGVRREFKDICCKYAGCMERVQDEMSKLKETFETEKKSREKEIEREKKMIEVEYEKKMREVEHMSKLKEIEMTCELKFLERELETQKRESKKNLEIMEHKTKEMLDYFMLSLHNVGNEKSLNKTVST
jgi:hypothetical protein